MTETQGLDLDPDGYQLAVDANPNQPIGLNDTLVVDQLPDGEHTLGLDGLAPNCTAGENPRTITVRSGTTANTEFTVVCSATTASLEIQVTVTGSGTDADGFVALLDGTDQGSIFPGPPASLPHVGPGSHTVGLSGLAANCRVLGDNPVSITVQAGDDLEVPFTVELHPPTGCQRDASDHHHDDGFRPRCRWLLRSGRCRHGPTDRRQRDCHADQPECRPAQCAAARHCNQLLADGSQSRAGQRAERWDRDGDLRTHVHPDRAEYRRNSGLGGHERKLARP